MSKLNDSTLKIFKKYRLDTYMSVFGNENKLYDVVKVMDDMVGNQVSKYVGAVNVNNSLISKSQVSRIAKDNSVFAEYSITASMPNISDDVYIYNSLRMKKITIFKPGDNIFPFGYLITSDGDVLCYVNLDIERKVFFCSSDKYGINNLTGTPVNKIRVVFVPHICFSIGSLSHSIPSVDINKIINGSASSNMTVNGNSTIAITLPEEIGLLGNTLYYNNTSISYYLQFPNVNNIFYITEV